MHIALLITNTDFSDFAFARPLDDEKFTRLIQEVRPNWQTTAFWVCKDEFPQDPKAFDGFLITGSPASVTDQAPWMTRLEALVREIIDQSVPLFGACFGHQIIAKALGAPIIRNPEGWVHGLVAVERIESAPWSGSVDRFFLYASHIEQVGALPDQAKRLFKSPDCEIAGFAIGQTVFTVQHHPEMTRDFITDLIDEYADYVGEDVTRRARQSVEQSRATRAEFALEMATFFEQARG